MLQSFVASAFAFVVFDLYSVDARLYTRRRENTENALSVDFRRQSLQKSEPCDGFEMQKMLQGLPDSELKSDINGKNAPLDEEGYAAVLKLKSKKQIGEFVSRVICHYKAAVMEAGSFAGTVSYLNGEDSEETYSEVVRVLRTASWLLNFQDAAKQPLNEEGYQEVAMFADDDQMRAYIRRVIASYGGIIQDEEPLFELTLEHSGTKSVQSYEELVNQLRECKWIKQFQKAPVKQFSDSEIEEASTKYNFVKEREGDQLLFIGVFSAPANLERRMEVRNSWMQDANFKGDDAIMSTKFIIGEIDDPDLRFNVEEESRMYGDIQFLSVNDSYENLPSKSVEYFRWFATKYCCVLEPVAHWYVMKLDDDTWPNFDYLLPLLDEKKETPSSLNYIGGLLWNGPVLREGKWAETADINKFDLQQYPAYAAGSGYILSMDMVRHFDEYVGERGITLLRNEDTTIGNWIHEQDHLTMAVNYYDLNFREYGCDSGQHLAMNLCPGEMRCMWEKRLNASKSNINFNVSQDMCCNPPEDYGLPAEGCL